MLLIQNNDLLNYVVDIKNDWQNLLFIQKNAWLKYVIHTRKITG